MSDGIRVLHVDDDPAFLDLSANYLSGRVADFDVGTETSVDAGLERLAEAEFDCVVSDYQMPDRDGLSFLEAVRERHSHLPFILFTGQGSEAVASDAVTMGATDYLQKGPGSDPYRLLANRIDNAVESHRARRELRQYRTLVETVGDAMYILDEDGVVTLANQAMAAMLGTDREEVVGSHASAFMAEGDFERGTELVVDILGDPERNWGTFEMTVVTTTGREIPGEINVAPITNGGGEYEATVGVVRDVTRRKERVERLRALHETTRELIDATDVDAAISRAVQAADQVLDLDAVAFFTPDERGDTLEPVAASDVDAATLAPIERDGGPVWDAHETGEARFGSGPDSTAIDALDQAVDARGWMVVPANGHGVLVAGSTAPGEFAEATEEVARVLASNLGRAIASHRREARLRERERELELYETAVESTMDGVAVLDASGEYLLVNREFVGAFGLGKEDIVGTSAAANEVTRRTDGPPDVVERHWEAYEEAVEEGTSQFRYESTVEIDDSEETFENLVTATRRDDGSIVYVTSTRNVTERLERERELERQNERLEEFARVVSHDLRTPLSVATGRLELASNECDSEHLDAVDSALRRMDALIDETLTMARQGQTVSETEPVDLGEMLPTCWAALDPPEASLSIEAAPTIRADRQRLRQVVENLLRNAIEHGGGDVTVRVGTTADGVFFADDGPGIPADECGDVLSPGYTTAEDGTGFGLAIVSEIAEAHGWEIDVSESEDGGARFEITGIGVVD